MNKRLLTVAVIVLTLSGCAAYRTDSNIKSDQAASVDTTKSVQISEGAIPDKKYKNLGPIEVSIKKLTAFHKDPTKEQANAALVEKARAIGADAVINVTYQSGIGLTTWGYMDAKGDAIKFSE